MSDDDTWSDEELTAELAAIDRSLGADSAAALSHTLAHRRELLALAADHQAAVQARRTVVVALLADAALPRRIAAFDRRLEAERDALAAAREAFAALPGPVASDDVLQQMHARLDQGVIRQAIDAHLRSIGYLAAGRAVLVARQRSRPRPIRETSGRRFSAPWSALTPAPLAEVTSAHQTPLYGLPRPA